MYIDLCMYIHMYVLILVGNVHIIDISTYRYLYIFHYRYITTVRL